MYRMILGSAKVVTHAHAEYHGQCAVQIPQLEVWFQRATDVVRKLMYGDIDIGIVGYDMFEEICGGDPDLMVLHEALNFGHCHLGLGVPMTGKFASAFLTFLLLFFQLFFVNTKFFS